MPEGLEHTTKSDADSKADVDGTNWVIQPETQPDEPDWANQADRADGAPEEPVTITEASRRVGVHPNTVRRLIHRGTLGGLLVKARHGDTWLVDLAELRRLVAAPRRYGPVPRSEGSPRMSTVPSAAGAAGTAAVSSAAGHRTTDDRRPTTGAGSVVGGRSSVVAGETTSGTDDWTGALGPESATPSRSSTAGEPPHEEHPPSAAATAPRDYGGLVGSREADTAGSTGAIARGLAGSVDLSLDRAQALERYTHSLLAPLVGLLREREAALDRREAIVRLQAERIGRLEREVELLRAQLARALRSSRPTATAGAAGLSAITDSGEVEVPAAARTVSDEVVSLTVQMERIRGDLRLMAQRLERPADQPDTPPLNLADAQPSERPRVHLVESAVEAAGAESDVAPSPERGTAATAAAGLAPTMADHQPPNAPAPAAGRFWSGVVAVAAPESPDTATGTGDTLTVGPRATPPVRAPGSGRPPGPPPSPGDEAHDPFVEAELAIRELQQALAAQGAAGPPPAPAAEAAPVPSPGAPAQVPAAAQPQTAPVTAAPPGQHTRRQPAAEPPRPWWRFW